MLAFYFHWSYRKYAILGYDLRILLANKFVRFFTFELWNMLILISGSIVTLYLLKPKV